jgi:hypothetical protein
MANQLYFCIDKPFLWQTENVTFEVEWLHFYLIYQRQIITTIIFLHYLALITLQYFFILLGSVNLVYRNERFCYGRFLVFLVYKIATRKLFRNFRK